MTDSETPPIVAAIQAGAFDSIASLLVAAIAERVAIGNAADD